MRRGRNQAERLSEHHGVPSRVFGETSYYVTDVREDTSPAPLLPAGN